MTCLESQQQAGMEGAGCKVLKSVGEREHCDMHPEKASWRLDFALSGRMVWSQRSQDSKRGVHKELLNCAPSLLRRDSLGPWLSLLSVL